MLLIKHYIVHSKDLRILFRARWRIFAMTSERKVRTDSVSISLTLTLKMILPRVLFLKILDSHSSFNTTDGNTFGIRKAAHYSRLPLERIGYFLNEMMGCN